MKPIHNFNNGNGATMCHACYVIITEGLTDDLLCEKCNTPTVRFYKGVLFTVCTVCGKIIIKGQTNDILCKECKKK